MNLLETLKELCELPHESATVEFKSNLNEAKEIGQYISALANAAALAGHARAWMVWGVENDSHTVLGTTFDPFTKKVGNQALVMWLQTMTLPRADFVFHECAHPQGKVVMLEIHPARGAPVAFQQVRYIRIGSHKTTFAEHHDKESRLFAVLGHKDDWSGALVVGATLEDLDPEAVGAARRRFTDYQIKNEADASRHEQIRRDTADWSVPTLLNKAHITKLGRITRSALLLLGRDESAHFLAPVDAKISWVLRDATGATQTSQHFGVPFVLATEKVFARIRNETTEYMPDGTLFPTPLTWYDAWVIREALHNCVAHQDYDLGGKINVVEHPDQLVFSNLGEFIPPSVEWMLENQSPPEHYRNQWLIDGMIRLRLIDQAGSGIRRMFETQRERFFPLPDYALEMSAHGRHPRVELAITRQVLDVKYTQALMKRSDLTLQQVLLLDRVQRRRSLTPDQARELQVLKLIEGRKPNYFIAAMVADGARQKALYIQNRGLDNSYYQRLVVEFLQQYTQATRKDLDALLQPKLPDILGDVQKAHKIKNLLQAMRKAKTVYRTGPRQDAVWHLEPDT